MMLASFIIVYLTYFKINPITGKVYYGRTSGKVKHLNEKEINNILLKRDRYHQKNKESFEKTNIDKISIDKDAIRGREHQQIQKHKKENDSANIYNGISPTNKNKQRYIQAAICAFGDLVCYAILINLYF